MTRSSFSLILRWFLSGDLLILSCFFGQDRQNQTQPPLQYNDVTASSQIDFKHNPSITSQKYILETVGAGAAFIDYDNDGLLDIYLANGAHLPDLQKSDPSYYNRLYRNNGDGTFTDTTMKAGVMG